MFWFGLFCCFVFRRKTFSEFHPFFGFCVGRRKSNSLREIVIISELHFVSLALAHQVMIVIKLNESIVSRSSTASNRHSDTKWCSLTLTANGRHSQIVSPWPNGNYSYRNEFQTKTSWESWCLCDVCVATMCILCFSSFIRFSYSRRARRDPDHKLFRAHNTNVSVDNSINFRTREVIGCFGCLWLRRACCDNVTKASLIIWTTTAVFRTYLQLHRHSHMTQPNRETLTHSFTLRCGSAPFCWVFFSFLFRSRRTISSIFMSTQSKYCAFSFTPRRRRRRTWDDSVTSACVCITLCDLAQWKRNKNCTRANVLIVVNIASTKCRSTPRNVKG